MSLYTRLGRVEVSSSNSELDSVASSTADSADELIEELARMALAGHYSGRPSSYETSQLLRGRGMTRRPRDEPPASPAPHPAPAASPSAPRRSAPPELLGVPVLRRSGARARPRQERDLDDAESDARALEKMYRHLAREYLQGQKKTAVSATAQASRGGSVSSTPSAEKPAARKPRRKPDEMARSRLLAPDRAQLARQTEKYERRKEREEEEARKPPKRVRVSPQAVKVGTRLYLEAQSRANEVKELQAEQTQEREAAEIKGCTFHPTISAHAARLAAHGDYLPFLIRLEEQAAQDEEKERLRIEQAVQREKECTFHPTICAGTEELVESQRRRRERRHQQHHSLRRRSSSASGALQRRTCSAEHGRPPASSREPFEPGERLYRDGGERLLRQQVRLQRASARAQRGVVGGTLRLSAEEAAEVADRFSAWAAAREAHTAEMRQALDQKACEVPRMSPRREARVLSVAATARTRSPSAVASSVSGAARSPRNVRAGAAAMTAAAVAAPASKEYCAAAPPRSVSAASVSSSPAVRLHADPTAHPGSSHRTCASSESPSDRGSRRPATITHLGNGAMPRTPVHAPVSSSKADTTLHKEQLRIRLGALFYKFAVSPTASTVTLAQVKEQVRCYYPEDAGIAVALAAAVIEDAQPISKPEFMAALARYVAHCGVQPWCLPRRVTATTVQSASEGGSAPAAEAHTDAVVRSSSDDPELLEVVDAVESDTRTTVSASPSSSAAAARSRRTHIYGGTPPVLSGGAAPQPSSAPPAAPATSGTVSQADPARRTTAAAPALPAPAAPTAQLVRGFSNYVQRQRGAVERARSAAAASARQREAAACTFRPTLSRRSVALSDHNLEKRNAYARELEVRRQELRRLGTAMLEGRAGSGCDADDTAGAEAAVPASSKVAPDNEPPPPPSAAQMPPPTPRVLLRPSVSPSQPDTSPVSGQSPSIELSSLSGSSPQRSSPNVTAHAGHTTGSPSPSRQHEGPPAAHDGELATNAVTRRAIADLEQLLRRGMSVVPSATTKPGARQPLGVPPPSPRLANAVVPTAATHAAADETTSTCATAGTPDGAADTEARAVPASGTQVTRSTSLPVPPSRFLVTRPARAILGEDDRLFASRHAAVTVERDEP